ncbi:MAG: GLPGLI family protein [Marinifilum sp.]|jgi:GLPGLI family protein|nr:GLPGLI family protein [Marinifilum sp.]
MKKYLLAFTILFSITLVKGQAQEKELYVIYDVVDQSNNQENKKAELRCFKNNVLYSAFYQERPTEGVTVVGYARRNGTTRGLQDANDDEIDFKKMKSRPITYKNHRDRQMHFYEEQPYNKIIKEDLNLFQWQMLSETDSILGYKCQKAKAEFRGRKYTAWFTSNLPFKSAPWKIHGLPGVVLRVESDDQFVKYTAIQLEIRKPEGDIVNPFEKKKSTSWEEFVTSYQKINGDAEEKAKASCAKYGMPFHPIMFMKPRVEIIIENMNRNSPQEVVKDFKSKGHKAIRVQAKP